MADDGEIEEQAGENSDHPAEETRSDGLPPALDVMGGEQNRRDHSQIIELENILESAYHLCRETIDLPEVSSRLSRRRKKSSRAAMLADLVERMVDGQADFWDDIRDVYLRRDLTRDDLRQIVSLGLEACGGSYQRLVHYFGLPRRDYKKFLAFLSNHAARSTSVPSAPNVQDLRADDAGAIEWRGTRLVGPT